MAQLSSRLTSTEVRPGGRRADLNREEDNTLARLGTKHHNYRLRTVQRGDGKLVHFILDYFMVK